MTIIVKKGKGQILLITGEEGIGKSRLFRELIKICNEKEFYILKGSCISYGKAFSYYPWTHILNEFFGITPLDPKENFKNR